jgi:hypothetical protein
MALASQQKMWMCFLLVDRHPKTTKLIVHSLAPQQLLAMKLMAWRDDQDVADARLLLMKLHGSREEIWRLIEKHLLPGRELKSKYAFEDLCDAERRS